MVPARGNQPGAPNWLEPIAAAMLIAGGDRASARLVWRQIPASDQDWLRRLATRRLEQLDALDVIDELERVARNNPPPAGGQYSWRWLISQRALPGVPVDSTRTPYRSTRRRGGQRVGVVRAATDA